MREEVDSDDGMCDIGHHEPPCEIPALSQVETEGQPYVCCHLVGEVLNPLQKCSTVGVGQCSQVMVGLQSAQWAMASKLPSG
jgi:hypothetical protein